MDSGMAFRLHGCLAVRLCNCMTVWTFSRRRRQALSLSNGMGRIALCAYRSLVTLHLFVYYRCMGPCVLVMVGLSGLMMIICGYGWVMSRLTVWVERCWFSCLNCKCWRILGWQCLMISNLSSSSSSLVTFSRVICWVFKRSQCSSCKCSQFCSVVTNQFSNLRCQVCM